MSEIIEQTEPLIILSDLSKPFLPSDQAQKHQTSSKILATQWEPSLSHFSYQKINKTDEMHQHIPSEYEQRKQWTFQEEKLLVKLHNLKGNRWVQISLILNQLYLYNRRSDNSVKNHFHSKLRRGARKINSYVEEGQNDCFKIIRNNFLAKIVQASEGVTVSNLSEKNSRAVLAYEIKNFILSASDFDENNIFTQQDRQCFILTLSKIKEFQALFKAKPKFSKIDGGIRYKGKEIKTLIKENQNKQKLKNEKNQAHVQAIKQQAESSIKYFHQTSNFQDNIYQEVPLYYFFGQQQTNFPFYNLPMMTYPAFTPISAPSSLFPIQDYPTQSTIGSYRPQNIVPEDDSRGSMLNSLNS